ncbi:MAG: Mg2 transporter protein CorA family protein [Parcubacteria group bacterium GW2011_GWF2_52_12]|uniref:Magnesium transport protein CorA n=1 Tax=Candidatus Vogelbacteria bacterium RIFOXYD1_FULL_51_18 TaxID=1802440 RepID=A0A1G2QKT5_9BACT|nr:MAG: Mg2 transporter protein CorA family protein [Parcubacteria group bacterium GW2011_GWF2_52_12]OHA60709.1 MAG: hypothetical protein A2569_00305 [Candidatus Vogelbacteria bacterium RIFOXYD1_FULL_51_18]HBC44320.1 hypothetical protein [Candidatus Vogelbacteria bacterium]
MITKSSFRGVTWIDMESPSPDDVAKIREEFEIHQIVAQEMSVPSLRPKVDVYSNAVYLVLYFPVYDHGNAEVDFIIGKDFIVTVHYERINEFADFTKLFEVGELMGNSKTAHVDAGFVFFNIMKGLYRSIEDHMESINGNLKDIERMIFAGEERRMVERISNVNRSLLDFHWALKNHEDLLISLESDAGELFDERFPYYIRSLSNEYYKITNIIEGNKEIVNDLHSTNDSLLTAKTNEVMKIFTLLAFVTFPLSLVANLFSMNIKHTPLVEQPYGFWIVVIMMSLVTVFMLVYFKRKRWF